MTIYKSKIRYNGIFPFKALYDFCYGYLTDELDLQVAETKYAESGTGSKEINIEWKGQRKLSEYFQKKITVEFVIYGAKEVDVEEEGQKVTKMQGDLKMKIKGELVKDWRGKFEENPFLRDKLKKLYNNVVLNSEIQKLKGKLFKEFDSFVNETRNFLNAEGER